MCLYLEKRTNYEGTHYFEFGSKNILFKQDLFQDLHDFDMKNLNDKKFKSKNKFSSRIQIKK